MMKMMKNLIEIPNIKPTVDLYQLVDDVEDFVGTFNDMEILETL